MPPGKKSQQENTNVILCFFFDRIDSELHYKLHYISQYEGRSANGDVIYLIRKAIEEFEKEHGTIERQ